MSVYFFKDSPRDIVAEVTWKFVGSWAWVFIVFSYGSASCDGKLSCEAVFHPGNCVSPRGRKIDLSSTVGPRSWNFARQDLRPSPCLAEVPCATALVFGEEIGALLINGKGHGVGPRTRNSYPLLVFLLRFLRKRVG